MLFMNLFLLEITDLLNDKDFYKIPILQSKIKMYRNMPEQRLGDF
jgi:hypothetical protein